MALIGLPAAALSIAVALADPTSPFTEEAVMGRVHADLDLNGDGVVDRSEYAEVGEARHFSDLDRNQDGGITAGELRDWVMLTPPRPTGTPVLQALSPPPDAPPAPTPPPVSSGRQPSAPEATPRTGTTPRSPEAQDRPVSRIPGLGTLAVLAMLTGTGVLAAGVWVNRRRAGRRSRRRR